uniref:BTB domain-containing protein n=1 Tax=Rhodnius prolixus TaxID=13249 RepID=T1I2V3_RHOPR
MGKVLSTVIDYCPESLARSVSDSYSRRRVKRKNDAIGDEESDLRKLMCTAHYIHQTLYVEGKDSDITVDILNKHWKLHKVYLGQSQYFNSMFSGGWNESNKSLIKIEVEDPNITLEAVDKVFSSFYLDEISVEPCTVIGVLAASTMFQLEGLIEQCCEIMLETISPITAVQYHQAACNYGTQKVKEKVIEWFLVNLTDYFVKNTSRLQDIDIDLMSTLVNHPDLCVIQSEMTLYNLLKKWVYCRLNPTSDSKADYTAEMEKFFRNYESNGCFLLSDVGLDYMRVFRQLRLVHLLLHCQDHDAVAQDRIIPESWLLTAYKRQWLTLLGVAASVDKGPESLDEKYFNEHCLRCGRVICDGDNRSWRWNWFSFGIDLVWSIVDKALMLGRQRLQFDYAIRPSDHALIMQVEVMNLDPKRQIKKRQKTEPSRIVLSRNQEVKLMTLENDFEYPLYIVIKMLLTNHPTTESQ